MKQRDSLHRNLVQRFAPYAMDRFCVLATLPC